MTIAVVSRLVVAVVVAAAEQIAAVVQRNVQITHFRVIARLPSLKQEAYSYSSHFKLL